MNALEPFLVHLDGAAEKLRALVEPLVVGQGLELVQLQLAHGAFRATLKLYVDKPGAGTTVGKGIVMADLEQLNRVIGDFLDVEDEQLGLFKSRYDLEVGSPGVDRPLTKKSHFPLVIGERVKVKTRLPVQGSRVHIGKLVSADSDAIVITSDGHREPVRVPYGEMSSANVVFVFEEKVKPEPKRKKGPQRPDDVTAAPEAEAATAAKPKKRALKHDPRMEPAENMAHQNVREKTKKKLKKKLPSSSNHG